MKKLLLFALLIASTALIAQPQLSWRFNNIQLINGNTELNYDVEVMADASGYYFGLNTVSFDYGATAFGSNIAPGNVSVTRGTLLLEQIIGSSDYKYNIQGIANTFPQTLGVSIEQALTATPNAFFHTEIPTSWGQLFNYTITIDPSAPGGTISEILFNQALMNGQCYYIDPTLGTNIPVVNPNLYSDPSDLFNFVVVPSANTWEADDGTAPWDWFVAENWSYGTVPVAGDDVLIPGGTSNDPRIDLGVALCNNMEVVGGVVTIAPSSGLTVAGNLDCDGGLIIETGNTGKSGSFICNGTISGTGTFAMDRDVVCYGNGEPQGDWHYISSPVDGFNNYAMYDYFVNVWNQTTGMWSHIEGDPTEPCDPAPQTYLMYDATHLDAFAVNWDADYLCDATLPGTDNTILFSGDITDLHNGAYGATAGFGAGSYQNWNMFGNPYPNSIDVTAIDFGAGIVEGVALWNGCTDNYTVLHPTTNPGFIPPTNAFFLETTAAGAFGFDGSEQAHSTGATFYKDDIEGLVVLEAQGDGGADELFVHFRENVTGGFDNHGDFHKLFSTAQDLPQIYTTFEDHKLAINARPEIDMLPMGFKSASDGIYSVSVKETGEFSEIYLEDLYSGDFTNLLETPYSFNYSTEDDANRFMIHFGALSLTNEQFTAANIWSSENYVFVEVPKDFRGEIHILNLMGQEVMKTTAQAGLNTIPMQEVNTYYIVKVVSNEAVYTSKVYIR